MGEWLEGEDQVPQMYDFIESAQGRKAIESYDYGKIKGSYDKFLVYKYKRDVDWDIIKERNGIFLDIDKYVTLDPDTSSYLLQNIYKELWPELVKQGFMIGSKKWICSDTMTSAATRFKDALDRIINEETMISGILL